MIDIILTSESCILLPVAAVALMVSGLLLALSIVRAGDSG